MSATDHDIQRAEERKEKLQALLDEYTWGIICLACLDTGKHRSEYDYSVFVDCESCRPDDEQGRRG